MYPVTDHVQVRDGAVLRLQAERGVQEAQGPRRGQARANLGTDVGRQSGPACSSQPGMQQA